VSAESRPEREGKDQDQEKSLSLWAILGLPEPVPHKDGTAPPVDGELLRRLVRQELPEQAARMAFRLIDAYREWNMAHAQLLVDEFKSRQADERSHDREL